MKHEVHLCVWGSFVLIGSVGRSALAIDQGGVLARYTTGGALDTTFNGTGKIESAGAGDDRVEDVEIASSDKVVACGSLEDANGVFHAVVSRFKANGTPDTTFGWLGLSTVGLADSVGTRCVVDSNGKIVVGVSQSPDHYLVRFSTNGAVDAGFGSAGYAAVDSSIEGVALAPGGKIVVSGNAGAHVEIARYLSTGVLDAGFATGGVAHLSIGWVDAIGPLTVDGAGRVVATGVTWASADAEERILMIRLSSSGALDTTFDSDGKAIIGFPSFARVWGTAVVTDSSDRPVVAGLGTNVAYTSSSMVVTRLTAAGVPDTTFNGNGRATVSFGTAVAGASDLRLVSGKIVVTGGSADSLFTSLTAKMSTARLTSAGALDTTFDGDGKVTTLFSLPQSGATAAAIDASGKVVVGGNQL